VPPPLPRFGEPTLACPRRCEPVPLRYACPLIPIRVLLYHFAPTPEGTAYGYEARLRGLDLLPWNADWYKTTSGM